MAKRLREGSDYMANALHSCSWGVGRVGTCCSRPRGTACMEGRCQVGKKSTLRSVKHGNRGPGRPWGAWRCLRSGSNPGRPDPKPLVALLLPTRLGAEPSHVLSNLNGPCSVGILQLGLVASPWPSVSHFQRSLAARLPQLGAGLRTFPPSWSYSPFRLCLLSSSQGAWKENRKLQSCWFLMGALLWMLLADGSRSRQVCAAQVLAQVITRLITLATAGLSLTPSKSPPSTLTSRRATVYPPRWSRTSLLSALHALCHQKVHVPTMEPLHHLSAAGPSISLVVARPGAAQILGE